MNVIHSHEPRWLVSHLPCQLWRPTVRRLALIPPAWHRARAAQPRPVVHECQWTWGDCTACRSRPGRKHRRRSVVMWRAAARDGSRLMWSTQSTDWLDCEPPLHTPHRICNSDVFTPGRIYNDEVRNPLIGSNVSHRCTHHTEYITSHTTKKYIQQPETRNTHCTAQCDN